LSYKNTGLLFKAGNVNSYEYSIAKNKLINAESNFLKAKYEIKFKQNILNFYQDIPFSL